ncbi:hypothetical protein KFL_002470180 [Klebsormidium nitens]|uniref:Uncharacterized protein n=1 Tax=Klebsormidium nitens TaxID=105231 RepID=A0A1Y1I8A8_KLENI|nr:hypothetical protein KFL_002470180 [Klebsormidium nitens]|eukprot:GAQ85659.1 hypothetical protein KFL_002470180 [Klebsormidium nitens]
MEIQVSAGPSPSVSSIWGLGKLVEPVHSASGIVPAKTVSWRHSAQSTAADPDTSSSISWLCVPDGTSFEALGDEIRRIGYDPHVYPPLVRGLRTRRLGRVGKMTMEVDQLGNYLPAVMDEIAKASHNGPIFVEDSATGGLKLAKDIFTEKISDNSSLQTVVGGLYRGYKQYVRDDPSSGEKVSWKRTFGVNRCQQLGQKSLPDAVDFFLRKAASSRELCAAMKAYLDGYFCLPGTAACNTATRARLKACFAHILARGGL